MSKKRIKEAYDLLCCFAKGMTVDEIISTTSLTRRKVTAYKSELSEVGIGISYRKASTSYESDWPIPIAGDDPYDSYLSTSKEKFFAVLALHQSGEIEESRHLLEKIYKEHSLIDLSKGSIKWKTLNIELLRKEQALIHAIVTRKKISFSLGNETIIAEPAKIINTTHHRSLLYWRAKDKAFKFAKLSKVNSITCLGESFENHIVPSDIYSRGEWDLIAEGDLQTIEVTFLNSAVENLNENIWHPSQKLIRCTNENATYQWTISSLEEFSKWILAWSGDFIINHPQELKNIIEEKINDQLTIQFQNDRKRKKE